LILRLARELRTTLDQRFEEFDLTSQQAALLIHVFTGQASPKRLADLLGTDTAAITRLVDRLEAKGLVTRSPDPVDRRAITVELTKAGRVLIPKLPIVFDSVGSEMTQGKDAGEVVVLLTSMLTNLEANH
jgi:DNA-binding MarR family transcriptional regulator